MPFPLTTRRTSRWALQVLLFLLATATAFAQPPQGNGAAGRPRVPTSVLGATPAPQRVPLPGPATDQPYAPQAILPGGIVVPIFPAGSPMLNAARIKEPEVYNMHGTVPGRIESIVNIHNPSIEFHRASPGANTGAAIIVVAGGGFTTLNVGPEGADFVPFFYNYGINTVILRSRLRVDGYNPQTDALNDMMQSIKVVRAYAEDWGIDPKKLGVIGFSAGGQMTGPAATIYAEFDKKSDVAGNPLAKVSSRPDFAVLVYPGGTQFRGGGADVVIPDDAPPTFIVSAGVDDASHAVASDEFFAAFLRARIPNVEMHIYGNGRHAGGLADRSGIPFGTWQVRLIDWIRDLGFLQKPGIETKAARDVAARVAAPPAAGRGQGGPGRGAGPGVGGGGARSGAAPAGGVRRIES